LAKKRGKRRRFFAIVFREPLAGSDFWSENLNEAVSYSSILPFVENGEMKGELFIPMFPLKIHGRKLILPSSSSFYLLKAVSKEKQKA